MLAAVVVALALTLGRGGESRKAVSAYIEDVNAVERRHAAEIALANQAYAKLDLAPKKAAQQDAALARAERALRSFRADVARVEAPDDARTLHAKLLTLVDGQIAFAEEVHALREYLPALTRVERRVTATTRALQRSLRARSDAASTATAFARYATGLDATAGAIAELEPPRALVPSRDARAVRLRELARLARRVAAELRAKKGADAEHTAKALARIAGTPSETAAARVAAIRAHNAGLRRLVELQRDVTRERDRLNATLD